MAYFGNKRQEVENIYIEIKEDLLKCDKIIEPYAGTSAMSYYISTLHPKRFTYIINDNNPHLINLYKIMKSKNDILKFETEIYKMMTPYPTKEEYKRHITNIQKSFK